MDAPIVLDDDPMDEVPGPCEPAPVNDGQLTDSAMNTVQRSLHEPGLSRTDWSPQAGQSTLVLKGAREGRRRCRVHPVEQGPSGQYHFDVHHWYLSLLDSEGGVYVMHGLAGDVSAGVKKELKLLYGRHGANEAGWAPTLLDVQRQDDWRYVVLSPYTP